MVGEGGCCCLWPWCIDRRHVPQLCTTSVFSAQPRMESWLPLNRPPHLVMRLLHIQSHVRQLVSSLTCGGAGGGAGGKGGGAARQLSDAPLWLESAQWAHVLRALCPHLTPCELRWVGVLSERVGRAVTFNVCPRGVQDLACVSSGVVLSQRRLVAVEGEPHVRSHQEQSASCATAGLCWVTYMAALRTVVRR